MNCLLKRAAHFYGVLPALVLVCTHGLWGADSAAQVRLDVKNAGPRQVESLTERGILRDYRFAWTRCKAMAEGNHSQPAKFRPEPAVSRPESPRGGCVLRA